MSKRDELFKTFGPKLIEATLHITLSEINIIRTELGLPERTPLQVWDQIMNHYSSLPDYEWMEDEP